MTRLLSAQLTPYRRELSKGHFSANNHNRFVGNDGDIPVYEAKMIGNSRLVVCFAYSLCNMANAHSSHSTRLTVSENSMIQCVLVSTIQVETDYFAPE